MATPGMPHKSRKKKKDPSQTTNTSNEVSLPESKASAQTPAFPLVAFFWPARKSTSQWVILPLVLMIVGLFRWCTGLWGYSGTESYYGLMFLVDAFQVFRLPQCTVTMKPNDIGWRSLPTSRYPSGTSTISNTGA